MKKLRIPWLAFADPVVILISLMCFAAVGHTFYMMYAYHKAMEREQAIRAIGTNTARQLSLQLNGIVVVETNGVVIIKPLNQ